MPSPVFFTVCSAGFCFSVKNAGWRRTFRRNEAARRFLGSAAAPGCGSVRPRTEPGRVQTTKRSENFRQVSHEPRGRGSSRSGTGALPGPIRSLRQIRFAGRSFFPERRRKPDPVFVFLAFFAAMNFGG
jgi:hypothetical protein